MDRRRRKISGHWPDGYAAGKTGLFLPHLALAGPVLVALAVGAVGVVLLVAALVLSGARGVAVAGAAQGEVVVAGSATVARRAGETSKASATLGRTNWPYGNNSRLATLATLAIWQHWPTAITDHVATLATCIGPDLRPD